MVEWYRAFSGMEAVVRDAEARSFLGSYEPCRSKLTARAPNGLRVDVTPPFRRLTVREAFRKHAGVADAAGARGHEPRRLRQTFVDRVELRARETTSRGGAHGIPGDRSRSRPTVPP